MRDSDRSPRYPGHLRPVKGRLDTALYMLLDEYDAYDPFFDDCQAIQGRLLDLTCGPNCEPIPRRAADVYRLLEALATRWNLHRIPVMQEMGYLQVRMQLCQLGKRIGSEVQRMFKLLPIGLAEMIPDEPTVRYRTRTWTYDAWSGESLKHLRDRIMRDLDVVSREDLPDQLQAQLDAVSDKARALGWPLEDVQPTLPTKVQWLFRRLCPQPDHVCGWQEIVNSEAVPVDYDTMRRTVTRLAREMGIALPPLRRGRPRTRS